MADPIRLTIDSGVVVDGLEDVTQLEVQGHTTQNEPLQAWVDAGGDPLAQISGDGCFQIGDLDVPLSSALIEANATVDVSDSRPQRAWQSWGKITGAVSQIIAWIAHELEFVTTNGDYAVGGDNHAALRTIVRHNRPNVTSETELRAGDFLAENAAGSVEKLVGVKATVENAAPVTDAAAIEATQGLGEGAVSTLYGLHIEDLNRGAANYAIHTGEGIVHLGDLLELTAIASTPANDPPEGTVWVYAKTDGKLYMKNASGQEYDLTA